MIDFKKERHESLVIHPYCSMLLLTYDIVVNIYMPVLKNIYHFEKVRYS